jgi:hypothetical protein
MAKGSAMHCPGCDMPVMTGPPPGVKYSDKPPDDPQTKTLSACTSASPSNEATNPSSSTRTPVLNPRETDVPATADSKAVATGAWDDDLSAPFRSLEEEKKAYDLARKQRLDETSKKIGEMLLQGYAMLNAECPNSSCGSVPLMKSRGGNPECVICCTSYVTDPMGRLTPLETKAKETAGNKGNNVPIGKHFYSSGRNT